MSVSTVDGDARLKAIQEALAGDWYGASVIQACLPLIYGRDEWRKYQERVMKELGLTEVRQEVLISSNKEGRWGQTEALGRLISALMIHIPGIRIAVFPCGKRAAETLIVSIVKARGKAVVWREKLELKCGTSEVSCYLPSGEMRGKSADVVLLPTAGFVVPDQFYEQIVPLLTVQGTVCLAFDAPVDEMNYSTAMRDLKDKNGNKVFHVVV